MFIKRGEKISDLDFDRTETEHTEHKAGLGSINHTNSLNSTSAILLVPVCGIITLVCESIYVGITILIFRIYVL